MAEMLKEILWASWDVLGEMAPYLLLGFLVAGILSVIVSPRFVEAHLGGRGLGPVIKAALFGVPLPLCSCGVIPVAASLHRQGASRAATVSFLLSTPQTGIDSIGATYSLMGPVFAVFRPLAALLTGILGGTLVQYLDTPEHATPARTGTAAPGTPHAEISADGLCRRVCRYGFLDLPRDIGRSLLLGIVVAGAISALVPEDFFSATLGTGPQAMLVMMLVGIPLYVCATGSVPIAAAFMAKGVSPGAALVFLITGPATNAATISTVWKSLGKRTAFLYLATVVICALAAGLFLDGILVPADLPMSCPEHTSAAWGWIRTGSALALVGILIHAWWPRRSRPTVESAEEGTVGESVTLRVTGMTCSHCAATVERALHTCTGVQTAQVHLDGGRVVVKGSGIEVADLVAAVTSLGYEARAAEA